MLSRGLADWLNIEIQNTGKFENALSGYSNALADHQRIDVDHARGGITHWYNILFEENPGETVHGSVAHIEPDQREYDLGEERSVEDYEIEGTKICDATLDTYLLNEAMERQEANQTNESHNPMGFFDEGRTQPLEVPAEQIRSERLAAIKFADSKQAIDTELEIEESPISEESGEDEEISFIAVYDEETGEYSYTSVSIDSPSHESNNSETSSDNSYSPDFDSLSSEVDSEGSSYEGDFDMDADFGISSDDD